MTLVSRWRWLVRQIARQLWLSAVLYALAALVSAVLGMVAGPAIPNDMAQYVNMEAMDRVLGILASSMLAVTTFSLATMVTAHGSVTANTSPRASTLIIDNDVTHNALGVFIGSFLFSLIGLVALNAGVYGDKGHVVLFFITVLVIVLIVVALLRWIDHLSRVARVSETSDRVEAVTTSAILQRAKSPGLGARALPDIQAAIPDNARAVCPKQVGYVQHIDVASLQIVSKDTGVDVYVLADPGSFVDPNQPLAMIAGAAIETAGIDTVREAFSIGVCRTYDYDPRFGLIVLGEIASRALSPGINDPGTAIDVIGRAVRILSLWATTPAAESDDVEDTPTSVWVSPLSTEDLFDDVFTPIARDGAGLLAVQIRLQKALAVLAKLEQKSITAAARHHSRLALERAQTVMTVEFDKEKLRTTIETLEAL